MFKKFHQGELEDQQWTTERRRPRRVLCCGHCMTEITYVESRVEKMGAHHHTFTNPADLTFNIGCFSEAPGCAHAGPATSEHTWFAGYRWRIALCRGCNRHLGWMFLGAADRFHGLILSQIVEKH